MQKVSFSFFSKVMVQLYSKNTAKMGFVEEIYQQLTIKLPSPWERGWG
jgi:hypothetical protein